MTRDVGLLLQKKRRELDLSLRDVEGKSGVSAATVCRIEAGQDGIFSNFVALAQLYGVSMNYLVGTTVCRKCNGSGAVPCPKCKGLRDD